MFTLPTKTVLVPTDLSEPSLEAVQVGKSLVGAGGTLHLLYVLEQVSPVEPGLVWGTLDEARRANAASEALREAADRLGVSDAQLHIEVADGNPAHRVAEMVDQLQADVVVLTSHGRTGLARLALGSVAERVVRLARCPVLVLK